MPSDVSAVLLTMGETTTERALASIERQTLHPAETIVVEGVTPFSAAIAAAVERVRTPYFVQVDADMILDDTCFERLRRGMSDGVAIACGGLRDPLLGTIGAVKLFRRECFELVSMPASVSPDVDFWRALQSRGWLTLFVLTGDASLHTFGEHRPDWNSEQTYATYHLLGCRYRRLRNRGGTLWRLGALRRSRHPLSTLARYALCTGLFYEETRDVAKSSVPIDRPLVEALAGAPTMPPGADTADDDWFGVGRSLGERRAYEQLVRHLRGLAGTSIRATWGTEVSLCFGFDCGARS